MGRLPRSLWVLIGIGVAIRLVFAFGFVGVEFDIESHQIIQRELADGDPLQAYSGTNQIAKAGDAEFLRWPYPPGFFPWIGISGQLENLTGLPFHGLVQVLPILCDVGLAIAIFIFLGWRGMAARTRLAGAALILLGPSFVVISGYSGQIDSVAILPAVLALMAFERLEPDRRAAVAGLLIGIGIAIKWVPAFALLALLPACRSPWEGARMVGAAALIPLLVLAPFALADLEGVRTTLGYSGAPGLGGLGLVVQPGLIEAWLTQKEVLMFTAPSQFLYDHTSQITLLGLAGAGAFLLRYRPAPVDAAVLVWLTVYAIAPNFFFQYLVWGLPFFLLAGMIRYVAILQLVVLAPTLIAYLAPHSPDVAYVYVPIMILVWVGWVVALFLTGRRIVRSSPLAAAPIPAH